MTMQMPRVLADFLAAVRAAVPELTWSAEMSGAVEAQLHDDVSVVIWTEDDMARYRGTQVYCAEDDGDGDSEHADPYTVGPVVTLHEMHPYSTEPEHLAEVAAAVRWVVSRSAPVPAVVPEPRYRLIPGGAVGPAFGVGG